MGIPCCVRGTSRMDGHISIVRYTLACVLLPDHQNRPLYPTIMQLSGGSRLNCSGGRGWERKMTLGPKTPEGRERCRLSHFKHGYYGMKPRLTRRQARLHVEGPARADRHG
jgi:hypothetical protein